MQEQNSIFELFAKSIPKSFLEEKKAAEEAAEKKGKGKKQASNVAKTISKSKNESQSSKKAKPAASQDVEVFLPVTVCYARIQQTFDVEDFDDSELIRTPLKATQSDVESDVSEESTVEHDNENSTVENRQDAESTDDIPVRVYAETIRKILERSFPELSKERTRLDYDKEKSLLVPVVFTGSKGAFLAPFDQVICQSKKINGDGRYLFFAKNGLYRLSVSPFGIMSIKLTQEEINALNFEKGVEGYLLKIPKIPSELLCQVISFFTSVAKFTGAEALANICFSGAEYYVDVPEQYVTSHSVQHYTANADDVVIQFHSHPRFPAFFSSIDDKDELRDGIYGVVSLSEKKLRLRMSIAGIYRPISIDQLIEDNTWEKAFSTSFPFPESWLRQVKVT